MGDIDKWLEILKGGKCIPEKDLKLLCDKVKRDNRGIAIGEGAIV